MCEGLWVEAVARGQVELLQPRTSLRDNLETGLIQEVAARQLQADQAETTCLHEAEGRNGRTTRDMSGSKEEYIHPALATFLSNCPILNKKDNALLHVSIVSVS